MRRRSLLALAMTAANALLASDATDASAWPTETSSPSPKAPGAIEPRMRALIARCGAADARLGEVADALVERKLRGKPTIDIGALARLQRRVGEPHVWPRAWVLASSESDAQRIAKLDAWLKTFGDGGVRLCGASRAEDAQGNEVIAMVAVDALADLSPLPVRAHAGQWLSIDARMRVPAASASVVVVGPDGAPRTLLASYAEGHVRARFAPPRPGVFTLQVLADAGSGPRPVLEATLLADVDEPADDPVQAPGEEAAAGAANDGDALTRMIAVLRAQQKLPALTRDARLDALAQAHARAMSSARRVGHDVGSGDAVDRAARANIVVRELGENVAHAATAPLAHRALYDSPSHRANLVNARFDKLGIGSVRSADGTVWVTQVFARFAD